jgi:hypothetical protein
VCKCILLPGDNPIAVNKYSNIIIEGEQTIQNFNVKQHFPSLLLFCLEFIVRLATSEKQTQFLCPSQNQLFYQLACVGNSLSHSQQYSDSLLILFLNLLLEGTVQYLCVAEVSKAIFALLAQLALNISRERNTTTTGVATKQRITGKNI